MCDEYSTLSVLGAPATVNRRDDGFTMKLSLRVVKLKNAIMINVIFFIGGCFLTLSLVNVESQGVIDATSFSMVSLKKYEKQSVKYVTIVLTAPDNAERRNAIRETWLKLPTLNFNSSFHSNDAVPPDFRHYFVIGTAGVSERTSRDLKIEQSLHSDILFLPHFEDRYASLTKKLLTTLQWLDMTFPNLLYVLKCDDDSFARMDVFLAEFNDRKRQFLKTDSGQIYKNEMLYWGYFKGNARVRLEGRWAEPDWILCDRYLPYALGGGYVISGGIVRFISKNADYLQLYKSEDAAVGVWTASLANVNRIHDSRFDTEWASRGCEHSLIIRHKQSPEEMKEMYTNLVKSKGAKLCSVVNLIRPSYQYNWRVLPSTCCSRNK